MTNNTDLKMRRMAPLATPSDQEPDAVRNIAGALNSLLADTFALYLKTKNFHWHISGHTFGITTFCLTSRPVKYCRLQMPLPNECKRLGHHVTLNRAYCRLRRIVDNDAEYVNPPDMLSELREDNKALALSMREVHDLCAEVGDVASTSLLEMWIDEAQRACGFVREQAEGRLI